MTKQITLFISFSIIYLLSILPVISKCENYIITKQYDKAQVCYSKHQPYHLEDQLNYITLLCQTKQYNKAYIDIKLLKETYPDHELVNYFYNTITNYFTKYPKLDINETNINLNNSKSSYNNSNDYCKMGKVNDIEIYSESCYKKIKYKISK